jgi:hypothetical protein
MLFIGSLPASLGCAGHSSFTILSGRGNLAVRPVGEKAFEANNRDCLSQSSLIEAVEPT